MNVLLVSGEFPDMLGGVGDYTAHLAQALVEHGCRVSVVTTADPRVRGEPGVEVRACVRSWGLLGLSDFLRACRELAPDCVAVQYVPHMYEPHGLPVVLPAYATLLRATVDAPLVFVCHEPFIFLERGRYAVAAAFQKWLLRYLAAISRFLVVTSESRARATSAACHVRQEKIRVIRVGSSMPLATRPERPRNAAERFRIVMFGSLDYWRRRPDVVSQALERIARRHSEVSFELQLIGSLPDNTASFLQALEKTPYSLRVRGRLAPHEVAQELAASDAAVLFDTHQLGGVSSRSAACSALLAAGIPIICNRGADTDPIFEGERNVLFSETSVEDLERQLERLLADPALRQQLSHGARELYAREFSWATIAKAFDELFREALER